MIKSKKHIFLYLIIFLYVHSVFSAEEALENLNLPFELKPLPSENLEYRRLILLIESGSNENVAASLYFGLPINATIMDDLLSALGSEPRTPILASENLVKNFALCHSLCDDFLHKTTKELEEKYGLLKKFENQKAFHAFIEIVRFLYENYTKVATLVRTYKENPTQKGKETVEKLLKNLKEQATTFSDQYGIKAYCEARTFFESYKAYDAEKWAVGKTRDGDFVFLPKDETGKIIDHGLNYKELEGFDEKPL